MSDYWDEYHRRINLWQRAGDAERLALVEHYQQGFECQEEDPEGSFSLFTRGRDKAIRLNEPWWVLFFEQWRLTAITSYVMDFTRARPLAIELMVRLNSEKDGGEHSSILVNVLYTYLNIDPIGYRNELEGGFAHLDARLPPEPISDRFVFNHRRISYLVALEDWAGAHDLALRALALLDETRDAITRNWHRAWALSLLCRICDGLGKLDEVAGYAEHMAEVSAKNQQLRRTQADASLWKAVVQRASGDENTASRSFHQGLRWLEGVDRRASACADPMARYHEEAGDLKAAIGVRDRELAEVARKGMLHRACQVHIERCRLLALAEDLTPGDLDEARLAFTRLQDPGWFTARLDRIVASPRGKD